MIKFHSPEERNNLLQNSSPPLVFPLRSVHFAKNAPEASKFTYFPIKWSKEGKNKEWNKERNEGIFAHRGIMTGKKNLDASKPRNVGMFHRKSFQRKVEFQMGLKSRESLYFFSKDKIL